MSVVLLQPPFFRCVGSHNDRPPLELCYASAFLDQSGVEHIVLNADCTLADTFVPWSQLFEQFELFQEAVDGKSPLYTETLERVLDERPKVVVISAGDALVPVLDCGSPWIGIRVSDMLRRYGVKTLGVGPFYGSAPGVFGGHFDGVVQGMCGPGIVGALQGVANGEQGRVYRGSPPAGVAPLFAHLRPVGQTLDTMLTAFGCAWNCDFCWAPKIMKGMHFVEPEIVARDLQPRLRTDMYIRDMVFPIGVKRLRQLEPVLKNRASYTVEARAGYLTPELMDAMKDCGVVRLKMGVEVLDNAALAKMQKGEGVAEIQRGIELAKEWGFKIVLYILLGGLYADRQAYERTYDYVEALKPDGVVVSVASYLTFDAHYRYDAHFSPFGAMQWAVGHDILKKFLQLEDRLGNKTITILR